MDLLQAARERHSVRSYTDKKIDGEVKESLMKFIGDRNAESGLNMQLVLDEPRAFDSPMAHYGKFSGVKNYIALIGKNDKTLDEKCGYYGEKVALYAQTLGLNTCWVALTYKKIKSAFSVNSGEKLCMVIALGYGETQGVAHRSRAKEEVMSVSGEAPEWFEKGIECALLAPTAMNQQKFVFSLDGNTVSAKSKAALYGKVDLGIAKCHFEIGIGEDALKNNNIDWYTGK